MAVCSHRARCSPHITMHMAASFPAASEPVSGHLFQPLNVNSPKGQQTSHDPSIGFKVCLQRKGQETLIDWTLNLQRMMQNVSGCEVFLFVSSLKASYSLHILCCFPFWIIFGILWLLAASWLGCSALCSRVEISPKVQKKIARRCCVCGFSGSPCALRIQLGHWSWPPGS